MIWFLLIFLTIYGSMHFIAMRKFVLATRPKRLTVFFVGLGMLVMMLAPIGIRIAERNGIEQGLHMAALIVFSWMGLLFIFLMLYLGFDLFSLFRSILNRKKRTAPKQQFDSSRRKAFRSILLFSGSLFTYGLFEANDLQIKKITLRRPANSQEKKPIRIVQISDIHLGLLVGEKKLKKIIDAIRQLKPDIVVSTGDLIDGQTNNLRQELELFRSLQPPLGKFAITGNHEFYVGLQRALTWTKSAGFKILRQQGVAVAGINIVGVDDETAKRTNQWIGRKEHELLASQPTDNFTILLKHQPKIEQKSLGLFDLQLSGHTHKGQIFPFNLITYLAFPFPTGKLVNLSKGQLYINPGTATWGPPVRLLAPPEITVFEFLPG